MPGAIWREWSAIAPNAQPTAKADLTSVSDCTAPGGSDSWLPSREKNRKVPAFAEFPIQVWGQGDGII
jgi:hypothetical protein